MKKLHSIITALCLTTLVFGCSRPVTLISLHALADKPHYTTRLNNKVYTVEDAGVLAQYFVCSNQCTYILYKSLKNTTPVNLKAIRESIGLNTDGYSLKAQPTMGYPTKVQIWLHKQDAGRIPEDFASIPAVKALSTHSKYKTR